MTISNLKLEWYVRDADRTAYGLPPDGLWNASTPCGSFLVGVAGDQRAEAERDHVRRCVHGCATASRVGQEVDWREVESGMLVRSDRGPSVSESSFVWHYVRLGDRGACVGCSTERRGSWGYMVGSDLPRWNDWSPPGNDERRRVTIIAEDVTGSETGAELRALSEAYDAKVAADREAQR